METSKVDAAIQALLAEQGSFAVRQLIRRTGLSRQALNGHLSRWLERARLVRIGAGRSVRYERAKSEFEAEYETADLREERVWTELLPSIEARAPHLTEQARAILYYAVTELVNNTIDHSGAALVRLRGRVTPEVIELMVCDEGMGAFESIRDHLDLEDELHALQELSKGKVTTQPERHSGEGLFFTSKAVDEFELHANGLVWLTDNKIGDQAAAEEAQEPGTRVLIRLEPGCKRVLEDVFAEYTTDLTFDRSRGVVRLFEHGKRFVSRSEAKRLAEGLDRFREVLIDFEGVEGVGQGFVDQLFRVWANAHPETKLIPVHMNRAVEFMVRRGLPEGGGE